MSTSGGSLPNGVLYVLVIVTAVAVAGRAHGGTEGLLRRPRPAALGLWAAVAVPSVLQFAVPALLTALSRQPELIERGQVWRLVTSAFVQDGGVFGTVFNLVVLYVVACAAMPVWGGARTVVLFLLGALGFDLVATFAFPSPGAGNSGATFALAAAVVVGPVLRERSVPGAAAAVLTAVAGAVLLLLGDAHGFAFLGGLVLGGLAALLTGHRERPGAVTP